ncbi:hypothetical protein ACQ3G6_05680 [Allorhizobium undicola]|uniref:hypothetical protein n=1 Tax=Allorhizobium undicola TaxID=78527 RepID=UPI0004890C68|nr:hypothetical protein [Allorhizobium undicola]
MPEQTIGAIQVSATAQPAGNAQRSNASEAEMEGLSFAQKETYRLARDAEAGNDIDDKLILNVIHPPALILFSLLNGAKNDSPADLQRAHEAYGEISAASSMVADADNNAAAAKLSDPSSDASAT